MKENPSNEKVLKPINDLIEAEKYDEALELIESKKDNHKDSKDFVTYFNSRIRLCAYAISLRNFNIAKDSFDKKNENYARGIFLSTKDLILKYIDYFDLNKEALQDFIQEVENLTANVTANSAKNIDAYRNQVISKFSHLGENFEETILVVLMDCYIYAAFSELLPKLRKKANKDLGLGYYNRCFHSHRCF